jgi:hypothetical protein
VILMRVLMGNAKIVLLLGVDVCRMWGLMSWIRRLGTWSLFSAVSGILMIIMKI